jgi:hypothetical protein
MKKKSPRKKVKKAKKVVREERPEDFYDPITFRRKAGKS